MIQSFVKGIFGSKHDRQVKKMWPEVAKVNEIYAELKHLSDHQLISKTDEFKERLANGETVDDILYEAFAVVKDACRRMCGTTIQVLDEEIVWDMIPYDVQLLGGMQLHNGGIAEMQTGEGKTLVGIMPLYLNALTGRNCHLVTTNEYLAQRDSEWVGSVLRYLGLTVGCIRNELRPEQRREEYAKDVTYGTNSEFGFDYLRDQGMARLKEHLVQRDHFFCIVDEIDNILIDEARTPLIISGPVPDTSHQYDRLKPDIENLVRKQTRLCTQLVTEAKAILDTENHSDEDHDEAIFQLVKVKMGMPKHKQLMRLYENPTIHREVDKRDTELHGDQYRAFRQEMKDSLYFTIDEKAHDTELGERGRKSLRPDDPEAFMIPDLATELSMIDGDTSLSDEERHARREVAQRKFDEKSEILHNIAQLLRAYCMYVQNIHYVIEDNKVVIVDEHTGRKMPGRRFSEGLHMALEAKEGVTIEGETQTLATITIQNYFRMYDKLSGMTGTAETEATEFQDIYDLDVLVIPTNRPCVRIDHDDRIYKTKREKYRGIIEEIRDCHDRGQPVLLGTVNVEVSEVLSKLLNRERIPHNVLNAKNHEAESDIIRFAGQRGSVTIATNMAGRGTDIRLGEGIQDVGGLHVIGSERHDSRRIDRQLRGRCARQGDPGSSRFYISLEDDLMRLFGSERISKLMERFGFNEGEELQHPWLNKSIEKAQRKVEQHHYSIRKRTLQYDDVMNKQREVVYGRRREMLVTEDPQGMLFEYLDEAVFEQVAMAETGENGSRGPVDMDELRRWLDLTFPRIVRDEDLVISGTYKRDDLVDTILKRLRQSYDARMVGVIEEHLHMMERQIMLTSLDELWQQHLYAMDNLRQEIHLQSYSQKDPLVEYKKEAFIMFDALLARINGEIARYAFLSEATVRAKDERLRSAPRNEEHRSVGQFDAGGEGGLDGDGSAREEVEKALPVRNEQPKVGRNDECPCGSGKKYKKCCGR